MEDQKQTIPIWSDFVPDLWEEHLPNFKEEILEGDWKFAFMSPSNSVKYGFLEENDEVDDEEKAYFVYTH